MGSMIIVCKGSKLLNSANHGCVDTEELLCGMIDNCLQRSTETKVWALRLRKGVWLLAQANNVCWHGRVTMRKEENGIAPKGERSVQWMKI